MNAKFKEYIEHGYIQRILQNTNNSRDARDARDALAYCHYFGIGVRQNLNEAVRLFKDAAE
jgi:TPR repeat protein